MSTDIDLMHHSDTPTAPRPAQADPFETNLILKIETTYLSMLPGSGAEGLNSVSHTLRMNPFTVPRVILVVICTSPVAAPLKTRGCSGFPLLIAWRLMVQVSVFLNDEATSNENVFAVASHRAMVTDIRKFWPADP